MKGAEDAVKTADGQPQVVASAADQRYRCFQHTVGDLAFSTDDDTVCRLAASPEMKDGLAFFTGALPAEFHFFPDHETVLRQVQPAATDFLAAHEQMLGKTLRQCLDTIGQPHVGLDSTHSHSRFFENSQLDAGRVLVTFNGIIGDSGINSPRGYFFLGDESRARYLKMEDAYRSANLSREVLRTVTRPTIADNGWSVTTALCFDNHELLPPFMPVQRNEDGAGAWRAFRSHFTSPLIAAGLSMFWVLPMLSQYKFFVTRPHVVALHQIIPPSMLGWYGLAIAGMLCWMISPTRWMWPFVWTCAALGAVMSSPPRSRRLGSHSKRRASSPH